MKIGFIAILTLALSVIGFGQPPDFTYQGRLMESSLPANGSYDFEFKLYNSASDGALLATQAATDIPVANGVFSVTLNVGSVFVTYPEAWLEIAVKPAGGTSYTLLTPRQKVRSAPYAIKANESHNAYTLDGLTADEYVKNADPRMTDARSPLPGSDSYVQNSTTTQPSSSFNISGDGTAGGTLRANAVTATTQFNIGVNRVLKLATTSVHAGPLAGESAVSGSGNSYFGNRAGRFGTGSSNNSFFGLATGEVNTANDNSFFGAFAGSSNTTGTRNSFFGRTAGDANQTGNDNSYFGFNSGRLASGSSNSMFGSRAGESLTSATNNSYFGANAGSANITGEGNSFFGTGAGELTTVGGNSFFGRRAGDSNTTGTRNSFFGYNAGQSNDIVADNSFFGYNAGGLTRDGSGLFSGSQNSFFGSGAGGLNIDGHANSFFGAGAGDQNLGGSDNVFIGWHAGDENTFGNNNTAIGSNANFSLNNLSFATAIGAGAVVNTSDTVQIGRVGDTVRLSHLAVNGNLTVNAGQTVRLGVTHIDGVFHLHSAGGAGDTHLCKQSSPSDLVITCASSLRYKSEIQPFDRGIELLQRLRPISFNWKNSGERSIGFAAEEVAEVESLLATYNSDGTIQGVKYGQITTVLVNAVKEQQAQIEEQKKQIDEQKKILNDQQRLIEGLKKLVCLRNPGSDELCGKRN